VIYKYVEYTQWYTDDDESSYTLSVEKTWPLHGASMQRDNATPLPSPELKSATKQNYIGTPTNA